MCLHCKTVRCLASSYIDRRTSCSTHFRSHSEVVQLLWSGGFWASGQRSRNGDNCIWYGYQRAVRVHRSGQFQVFAPYVVNLNIEGGFLFVFFFLAHHLVLTACNLRRYATPDAMHKLCALEKVTQSKAGQPRCHKISNTLFFPSFFALTAAAAAAAANTTETSIQRASSCD